MRWTETRHANGERWFRFNGVLHFVVTHAPDAPLPYKVQSLEAYTTGRRPGDSVDFATLREARAFITRTVPT